MGSFNFYINVDQCLNMSNFDMFFYKLQSEQKFHLSNVQFFDDKGKQSLKSAFYEIRSYMDKMPFLVQDYRLIFGMRETFRREISWKKTILYRLLKIYYGLKDANIYIKSRDAADKNVSVIMLYDTDFTVGSDDPDELKYNPVRDLALLMEYIGVEIKNELTDEGIIEGFQTFLGSKESELCRDAVTRRFAEEYIKWADRREISKRGRGTAGTDDMEELLAAIEEEERRAGGQSGTKSNVHNILFTLIMFTSECVGHYCVFTKEISRYSLDQNLLALLSIVDYITSDLHLEKEDGSLCTNKTLREQSRKNWARANNDTGIQQRYGMMITEYKSRLQTALREMTRRGGKSGGDMPAPSYSPPERLQGSRGLKPKDQEIYRKEFDEILQQFLKDSINRKLAESSWKKTYQGMKDKLERMDEELQLYARDLSARYKSQLEDRKTKKVYREDKGADYSQEDVDDKIEVYKQRRTKLLDKLKKPQMNPSLTFQDQLNFEHTLEQCNLEVSFFVKCHKMVKLLNFLLLILIGGGIFCLHYIIMQGYLFSDVEKLSAFLLYIGAAFILFLTSWGAPYCYFKKKIKRALDELKKKMEVFIRGYFEKAENFQDYINTINELDAVTAYIDRLQAIKESSSVTSRRHLWHTVQIQEHLRKSGYFDSLMYSLDYSGDYRGRHESVTLDEKRDVIHNRLYWPQGEEEGKYA